MWKTKLWNEHFSSHSISASIHNIQNPERRRLNCELISSIECASNIYSYIIFEFFQGARRTFTIGSANEWTHRWKMMNKWEENKHKLCVRRFGPMKHLSFVARFRSCRVCSMLVHTAYSFILTVFILVDFTIFHGN